MKKEKTTKKSLIVSIVFLLGGTTAYAKEFSKEDKNAECYIVRKSIPAQSEPCNVTFAILNEDENSAVTVYKNQIFRMTSQTQCDSEQADSCYVDLENLAFGRANKLTESEYMYLKEEDAQTYYRSKTKKRIHVNELFKPISDSWATCMKSKSYDFCIQSKYSIEKIPKLRNEF